MKVIFGVYKNNAKCQHDNIYTSDDDDNDNNTTELSDTLKYVYACRFYLKHGYGGCNEQICYDYWKSVLFKGI